MNTSHHSHAALLQLIAEGLRSSPGERFNAGQRDRIAVMLDRIAVDLLVPTEAAEGNDLDVLVRDIDRRAGLHS